LVPTIWSITACDTIIADNLLKEVRSYNIFDKYRVYEFQSLNNYYAVLLLPTEWQYEWIEAFLHVLGREELIFADHELNGGKKEYSRSGCYYTCKMAVLEALAREKKQAGAIVLREAYNGYVHLGVFNVWENVRSAMNKIPLEFEDMKTVLNYIESKLEMSMDKFKQVSTLLKDLLRSRQTTLDGFFKA